MNTNANKKYKVHQYDTAFKTSSYNYHRSTHFFDTLEEAKAFAKEHNEECKKYGFTDLYVVEDIEKTST